MSQTPFPLLGFAAGGASLRVELGVDLGDDLDHLDAIMARRLLTWVYAPAGV
jgi:hypothetical protein